MGANTSANKNSGLSAETYNNLINANTDIKKFSFNDYETFAKVVSVYDGDTITVIFPYNLEMVKISVRMNGYNCAEIKSKSPEEKAAAIIAKDFLSSVILGKIVKIKFANFDKYGRALGTVYNYTKSGEKIGGISDLGKEYCINEIMLKEKYGKPYTGSGPKEY